MDAAVISLVLLLITFIAGIFTIIVIHELGHLVFGFISGYRFLIFRIWKLAVVKTGQGYRIHNIRKPDSFGQCIMYPKETSQNPKIMMYGGIIFNLLYGILFLTAGIFLNDYIIQNMSGIIGGLNVICALFNYASRYITDDGQGVRDMKNPIDIICYNCQLMIARHLVNGDSFKDMDSRMFVIGSLLPDSSTYEKEMYFYGYYRLLEQGCFKQAIDMLYELEASDIKGWLAAEVRREQIFFYNLKNSGNSRIGSRIFNPNDIRINNLDAEMLTKFKKFIYPGEVKSTRIILEEVRKQYLIS